MGYSPNTSEPQGTPGSLSTKSNIGARGIIACLIPAPHRGQPPVGTKKWRARLATCPAHNISPELQAPLSLLPVPVAPGHFAILMEEGSNARRAITELWFTADLLESLHANPAWVKYLCWVNNTREIWILQYCSISTALFFMNKQCLTEPWSTSTQNLNWVFKLFSRTVRWHSELEDILLSLKQIRSCNTETLSRALSKLAKPVSREQVLLLPSSRSCQQLTSPHSHVKEAQHEPHRVFLPHNFSLEFKKLLCGVLINPSKHNWTSCSPVLVGAAHQSIPSHSIPLQPHSETARSPLGESLRCHKTLFLRFLTHKKKKNSIQNRKAKRKKKIQIQPNWFSHPQPASHAHFSPFPSFSTFPFPVNPHKCKSFPWYKGIFPSSQFLWLCWTRWMSQTDEPVLLWGRKSNNYTQPAPCEEGNESRSGLNSASLGFTKSFHLQSL